MYWHSAALLLQARCTLACMIDDLRHSAKCRGHVFKKCTNRLAHNQSAGRQLRVFASPKGENEPHTIDKSKGIPSQRNMVWDKWWTISLHEMKNVKKWLGHLLTSTLDSVSKDATHSWRYASQLLLCNISEASDADDDDCDESEPRVCTGIVAGLLSETTAVQPHICTLICQKHKALQWIEAQHLQLSNSRSTLNFLSNLSAIWEATGVTTSKYNSDQISWCSPNSLGHPRRWMTSAYKLLPVKILWVGRARAVVYFHSQHPNFHHSSEKIFRLQQWIVWAFVSKNTLLCLSLHSVC